MVSKELIVAVKTSLKPAYAIAHKAGIHPTTLSQIMNGYTPVSKGDKRVIRIGRAVGVKSKDCFK